MEIKLKRAGIQDATTIWKMQIEAFSALLGKYQDFDNSPGNEPIEKVILRLKQPQTYFYFVETEGRIVGAIRVVDPYDNEGNKSISPIFIMPESRNRGFAQQAILEAETIHGNKGWLLDTILQESGNCHLYEKTGYHKTGRTEPVNDKMTLVFYEK